MNEELHNIDDLFRKGMEGHEETVPGSVWEAVSNDLDKKQASYYKNKYNRLKRWGLTVIVVCFFCGSYLVYEGLKKKPEAPALQHAASSTAIKKNTIPEESGKPHTGNTDVTNKSTSKQITINSEEKNTSNEQDLKSTNGLASQEQREKQAAGRGTQNGIEERSLTSTSNENTFAIQSAATPSSKKTGTQDHTWFAYPEQPSEKSMAFLPLTRMQFIAGRSYTTPLFQLAALEANHSVIPPATQRLPAKNNTNFFSGISLTAFAAPNLNFNRLEDDNRLAGPGRNRREAHHQEQNTVSISSGVLLNYEVLKKLRLQTGVTVTSATRSIDSKTIYAIPDSWGHTHYELHCTSGYIYLSPKGGAQPAVGDSAEATGTTSSITYVTIPVGMGYHIGNGKFSFTPSLGFGLNILIGSKAATILSNTATREKATSSITGLKPTYIDGHLGLGMEYNLNKKLSVGVRPNARLALNPINHETPVKSYQNFLSLETGLRIKL